MVAPREQWTQFWMFPLNPQINVALCSFVPFLASFRSEPVVYVKGADESYQVICCPLRSLLETDKTPVHGVWSARCVWSSEHTIKQKTLMSSAAKQVLLNIHRTLARFSLAAVSSAESALWLFCLTAIPPPQPTTSPVWIEPCLHWYASYLFPVFFARVIFPYPFLHPRPLSQWLPLSICVQ